MVQPQRYQIFLSYGIVILSIWCYALKNKTSLTHCDSCCKPLLCHFPSQMREPIIDYAPLWVLALLGLYALGSVVVGVLNFSDCPEAAKEVEADIKEAKIALTKMGVKM